MPKQPVTINFSSGLNTKNDPWQLPIGQFQSLQNSVFSTGSQLKKRNGYGYLPTLPNTTYQYLTTLNDNLTAIGHDVLTLDSGTGQWVSKGNTQPVSLSVLPLIRNSLNQSQCDSVVAPNGLVCTVYTESTGKALHYKYVIANSTTGQNIVSPKDIPVASGTVTGSPRVFLLGSYFVIIFTNVISTTSHLQYISISTMNPMSLTTNQDIAASYVSSTTLSWDGLVFSNRLYVAYNTTSGGQAVKVTYLSLINISFGQVPTIPTTFLGSVATLMSLCVDQTTNTPFIYLSFYNSGNSTGFVAAVDNNLHLLFNPVEFVSVASVLNIASAAQGGVCSIIYEVADVYGYDNNIPTNFINLVTIKPLGTTFNSVFSSGSSSITASSAAGLVTGQLLIDNTTLANIAPSTTITVSGTTLSLSINTAGNSASSPGDILTTAVLSSTVNVIRSLGLASKAFIINGTIYFLAAYQSGFQSTYFLINGNSTAASPLITAKLAYENGGGYLATGLPGVTLSGDQVQIPYLYKDLIEPIATVNNTQQSTTGGVYAQTGVNLVTFNLSLGNITSVEIASGLQIGGGFGWLYDGYLPVEQNFFLWPENVEVSTNASAVTPTGTTTTGSNIITALSSMVGIGLGAVVSGTGIPANQTVMSFTSTTLTFGPLVATGSHTAETITVTGNISTAQQYYYQAIYQYTDNAGNVYMSAGSIPVSVTTTGTTSTNTINIPMLRLTYKPANSVKIVLYRWSDAQEIYYQVTSVAQPTISSTTSDSIAIYDSLSDSFIAGNSIIYLTGGVVEDINPPASNIMTLFDTRAWLVDAEDPNLLWFSKQVIEAVPVEWSDLLTFYIAPNAGTVSTTGPITAIAPMDDKLVIFKQNAMYYINGIGPDNTGVPSPSYNGPIFITSTVGCTNPESIVLIDAGLMFQSNKGIWLLPRGISAPAYIGAAVEEFNQAQVQSAVSVPMQNEVRQTISTGQTLLYDYFYNQWGTFTGTPAVTSCIYENLHSLINKYGQVFQETPGAYLDGDNPVLMSFQTGWINAAALQGFERIYEFYILGRFLTPCKLLIQIAYDYSSSQVQSALITPTNFSTNVPSPFGEQPAPFGADPGVMQWRVDARKQKCQSFQITLTETYDPSLGIPAGAGFTLSGINMLINAKSSARPIRAENQIGLKNG